ncbi:MAG: hypothetical protein QS98_C0010G0044 [archaeon GW2011_AR3]|nr:MAG: hypothetical protein QS98_C0010G0044 [archaeon GW2011_AR3]MBS3110186.1 hypothetical protein [Candidatus Woesearchaeota archaeon]
MVEIATGDNMVPLALMQNRIANISISPSTLRGQPKGSVKIAIDFLQNMNLQELTNIKSEVEFISWLDSKTHSLMELLPSKSWGMARKSLNIFLFQVVHDIFLSDKNNLRNLIPYLELTLDNPNAKKLMNKAKEEGIKLNWSNINNLQRENSDSIQIFARKLAKEQYTCDRCYLDLYFWRV